MCCLFVCRLFVCRLLFVVHCSLTIVVWLPMSFVVCRVSCLCVVVPCELIIG